MLFYTLIHSPLGLIGLASSETGLVRVRLQLASETEFAEYLATLYRQIPSKRPRAFSDMKTQFNLYFKGRLKQFVYRPDFGTATPFQCLVWRKLRTIPYGKTRSYRWLARAIGKPAAYRAAGNANGRNPLPIIIPCHRVIRENGCLGGYTGGTHIKQFLLDLEQTRHGTL
ncbi:MAG: methylated-DNA--[protein]-cysteine S-methyltransferase [Nitrospinales bacterium]